MDGASEPAAPDASRDDALDASADDGLDADIAELSAATSGGEQLATPAAQQGGEARSDREIVYRVTPTGLVVEIDGLHLRPEAKPFRDRSGAYGIALVVKAESFDGRRYWLSSPSGHPLSVAGKVEAGAGKGSAGAKDSRFGDERRGGGELVVLEDSPRKIEQRWPGRGQPKLRAGQTVTLEVGLWGMRAESDRERPVRRLFVVKMMAGPGAQAVITPPTLDWGS